jgi:hypothetical protein
MEDIGLASVYRLTATNYRSSAVMLAEAYQRRGEVICRNIRTIPFYYLMSHAIELLLKCALLKRGFGADELRRYPLGHDLRGLLEKLDGLGIQLSDSAAGVIRAIGPQHLRHGLRYTALLDDGQATYTPEPAVLFDVYDELLLGGRISAHGR